MNEMFFTAENADDTEQRPAMKAPGFLRVLGVLCGESCVWSEVEPRYSLFCMSVPFRYHIRVRYGECDAQKVVFNARWADYLDVALLEFLRAIGYGDAVTKGVLDYQSRKLTLEWKAPARFDQVLEISISAKHLGRTSFTIGVEFRIAGEETVIVTAESVHVCVDPKTM